MVDAIDCVIDLFAFHVLTMAGDSASFTSQGKFLNLFVVAPYLVACFIDLIWMDYSRVNPLQQ